MLTNYAPDSSAPQHRDGVGTNHIRARENPGERPRTERTGRGKKGHDTSREMCHFHPDKFTDLGNRNPLFIISLDDDVQTHDIYNKEVPFVSVSYFVTVTARKTYL